MSCLVAGTDFLLPAVSQKKDMRGENQLEVTAGELAESPLKKSSNRTFRRVMVEKWVSVESKKTVRENETGLVT